MLTVDKISNILKDKGIIATARIYSNAVFNPATNKTTLGNYVDYSIIVVPPYSWREGFRNAVLVSEGKAMTGIANKNLGFEVKPGILLIINNIQWEVLAVTLIQSKNGILYYQLEIQSK